VTGWASKMVVPLLIWHDKQHKGADWCRSFKLLKYRLQIYGYLQISVYIHGSDMAIPGYQRPQIIPGYRRSMTVPNDNWHSSVVVILYSSHHGKYSPLFFPTPHHSFTSHRIQVSAMCSAWKSSPVQSFVKFWQDQDLDQSSQVDKPQKTGLNRCQPVQCSFHWFSTVERPVSTGLYRGLGGR